MASSDLLLIEHLAIVWIVEDEQKEERREDEGETASVEEGYKVLVNRREWGGGEVSDLITVGESKSEQVRPLSRGFLSASEWENDVVVECTVA